jgi:hypothetical protein
VLAAPAAGGVVEVFEQGLWRRQAPGPVLDAALLSGGRCC